MQKILTQGIARVAIGIVTHRELIQPPPNRVSCPTWNEISPGNSLFGNVLLRERRYSSPGCKTLYIWEYCQDPVNEMQGAGLASNVENILKSWVEIIEISLTFFFLIGIGLSSEISSYERIHSSECTYIMHGQDSYDIKLHIWMFHTHYALLKFSRWKKFQEPCHTWDRHIMCTFQ